MRTRILGAAASVHAVAALAAAGVLIVLAGCVSAPSPSALLPTPSPSATLSGIADVGDEVVLLDCPTVVPVDAVAGVLGVSPAEVALLPTSFGTTPPFSGNVSVAMALTASNRAGEHECRYGQVGSGEDGPTVSVAMLPGAATEFDLVQPDSNDGLPQLAPSDLGDKAFSGCREGEWQGCRAEVLTGQTWLSISVARSDLDPADFTAYAGTVVDAVAPLKLARPAGKPRPECGALLSPHDLSDTGGLAQATDGEGLDLGSLVTAAEIRGGLVQCGWAGEVETGYQGLTLTILPGVGAGWSAMSPAVTFATETLPSIDLYTVHGARWPASGVDARGACTADGCTVTVMADSVWLTVATSSTSGATDLEAASALAAAAYARYAATM